MARSQATPISISAGTRRRDPPIIPETPHLSMPAVRDAFRLAFTPGEEANVGGGIPAYLIKSEQRRA
jgi:hypothetical protein